MKKVSVNLAIVSLLLAIIIEWGYYLKGWRADFFSMKELFSIITFAAFLFVVLFAARKLFIKIRKERAIMSIGKILMIIGCSLLLSTILFYLDDDEGLLMKLNLNNLVWLLIYSFHFFCVFSFVYLLARKRI